LRNSNLSHDAKARGFGKWSELAVELKRAVAESSLEGSDKLTAEDTAEYLDGKKKGGAG
jgi:hypothetical protein